MMLGLIMTRLGVSTGWRQTRSIDRSFVFFKQALESKGMYSKCDAPTVTNISCMHFICFGSKITFIFFKYVLYFLITPCLRLGSYLMHSFTVADWLYGLQANICLFLAWSRLGLLINLLSSSSKKGWKITQCQKAVGHSNKNSIEFLFIFLKQSIIHWLKIFTMHTTRCLIYQYSLVKIHKFVWGYTVSYFI